MDGSFKEVTEEAFRIGKVLKEYGKLLMETKVQTDDIGILYSLESDLINRIENTVSGVNFWSFESTGYPYLYKKALVGVYTLFRELGIVPQWVDTRQLKERMNSLKLLYLPETFILMEDSAEEIKKFIENGGSVIAEEGVGLRSENTWLNTQCPGGRLGEIFGVKINERVAADKEQGGRLNLFGRSIPAGGYLSYLQPRGSEIHGCWENGRTGATRKGNAIFIGTSLGASFHDNYQALYEDYVHIMLSMLDSCGIHLAYNPSDRGLYIRKLTDGDKVILFAFNRSGEARKIALSKDIKIIREICTGGTDTTSEIPAYDVRVYLCNATRKEEKCITHAIE